MKINKVDRSLALNKKIKIATLLPKFTKGNSFWKAPIQGINSAQMEVEVFGVSILKLTFDQFDVASYLSQINELLNSNPDV